MIECTDKKVWYIKNKKGRKGKRKFKILLIIILLAIIVIHYYQNVSRQVFNICKDTVYSYSNECINTAVLISLNDKLQYSDLINVEKNSNGEITLISVNSYKTNYLSKSITSQSQILIKNKLKDGIPVPALTFLGIGLLSGQGKDVYVKTVNVTSLNSDFSSEFKSVGINQTLHSVYINVKCALIFEIPLNYTREEVIVKILVSESVLVGKVPEIYLSGGVFN